MAPQSDPVLCAYCDEPLTLEELESCFPEDLICNACWDSIEPELPEEDYRLDR